jgi:serine phosphatase RsbU (regulator of sigma subunit)
MGIESNGLVFGVTREPDYPVREIKLCPGDRLLLYTDGVIEPEKPKARRSVELSLSRFCSARRCARLLS